MFVDGMIVLFQTFVVALLELVSALLPDVPPWVGTGFGFIGGMWALLLTFAAWLPISFGANVLVGVMTAYLVALVVGTIRMVVSYFTFGGGAT